MGCGALAAGVGMALGLAWSAQVIASPSAAGPSWQASALGVLLGGAALVLFGWQQWRASSDLREARDRLRCMDELLDVWQWQTDAEHRLVRLRPPRGAPSADWSAALPGAPLWQHFRSAHEAALRAQLASHAPLDDIDVQHQAADGGPRHFSLRGRARTDAAGRFTGYQGLLRETGALTAAPATSTATSTAAEKMVAYGEAASPASLTDPATTGPDTESSDSEGPDSEGPDAATLGSDHESFSFTVSHDLRAPIRVVEGFTKIIKEDYGRLLDRVGNDHLDRVLAAAARMNNMIDALLALSKLSSQPLARQPVNLSQLATYVADDLRRQCPEREVQIDIEPAMLVLGDPTLLRVLIENLLGNAWKYSAKAAQPLIAFKRRAGEPNAFTVSDNGAGFDMRFADRLFGVFQRLHGASDFPGTGVGLASVRRIVRRHGGEIWGEAEVNHGASFHFSLPLGRG